MKQGLGALWLLLFVTLHHSVFGDKTSLQESILRLEHATLDTLTCHVTTQINQSFTLSWLKEDKTISSKTHASSGAGADVILQTLTLARDAETTGVYKCFIQETGDDGRNWTSNSIMVKRDTPYLKISLPNPTSATMSLRINETASIPFYVTCIVASFPTANVTFKRNGEKIQDDGNHVQISTTEKGDTIKHTLVLKNASYRDAAEYVCRASNGAKSDSVIANKITLKGEECSDELLAKQQQYKCEKTGKCVSTVSCGTIQDCKLYHCERPDTPADAKIMYCTHDAVKLIWTRDVKARTYTVYIDKGGDVSKSIPTITSDVVVDGLESNNEYMFSIVAHNDAGQSKEQAHLKCRTTRLERPSRIPKTDFHHLDNGLVFGWNLPADDGISNDESKMAEKLQYQVEYCPQLKHNVGVEDTPSCKSYMTNDTSLPLKDKGMKANNVYKFSVSAINRAGKKSEPKIVYYTIPSNTRTGGANGLLSNIKLLLVASTVVFTMSFIYT